EISPADQAKHRRVERSRLMFGVRDHRKDTASPFQAITDAATRMIEAGSANDNAGTRLEYVARNEIPVFETGAANVQSHRKPGRPHEFAQHLSRRHQAREVAGPEHGTGARIVERREER